jgi:hypothetical protein
MSTNATLLGGGSARDEDHVMTNDRTPHGDSNTHSEDLAVADPCDVHVVPVLQKPILGPCRTTESFVEELNAGRAENRTASYFLSSRNFPSTVLLLCKESTAVCERSRQ